MSSNIVMYTVAAVPTQQFMYYAYYIYIYTVSYMLVAYYYSDVNTSHNIYLGFTYELYFNKISISLIIN